jgi:hypothetical protein
LIVAFWIGFAAINTVLRRFAPRNFFISAKPMTVVIASVAKRSSVLTLILTLTENEGFSPEFIYERARLRALSS